MAFVMDRDGRARAASRNPLTLIGRDICASHVLEVWDVIPKYINDALLRGVGLRIPGLVTFGYKERIKCECPMVCTVDKFVHMVVNGKLAYLCSLKTKKVPYTLAPSTDLNISKICQDLNMPRYAVQASIDEVIHAFKRALVMYREVDFVFEGIGTLRVKDNIVSEQFCCRFLRRHFFFRRVLRYKNYFPCVCSVEPPETPYREYTWDDYEDEGCDSHPSCECEESSSTTNEYTGTSSSQN